MKSFNEFEKVEEGWKQNLLLSISLLLANPAMSKSAHGDRAEDPVENGADYANDFWKACFQLCQDLKSPRMSVEERAGLLDAQMYFQSKRDKKEAKELSKAGQAVRKIIMDKVSKLSPSQIDDLVRRGASGAVYGSTVGL